MKIIACKCGHGRVKHLLSGRVKGCTSTGCSCNEYRAVEFIELDPDQSWPPVNPELIRRLTNGIEQAQTIYQIAEVAYLIVQMDMVKMGFRKVRA